MRDYKYLDLVTKKPESEECVNIVSRVRSQPLQQLSGAFSTNLKRIAAFSIMPAELSGMALRDGHLAAYAMREATGGKLVPSLVEQLENPESTSVKYTEIFESESKKIQSENDPLNHIGLLRKYGVGYIQEQLKLQQGMRESMEAILSSVVVESWTAFESLAGDLWVAGVDNEPGEATARLIYAGKSLRHPDDNIRPETVYHSGIHPKTQYGSFLKAIDAVSFQKLWEIKKYYGIAFEKDAVRLFDEIDGGYVEVLSAFRNALTHAGGRADKKFKERLNDRFPEFDTIREGDRLVLDGQLASRLNLVAAKLGSALITHIDNILSPPSKTA
jgi:hypothetical protein